MYGYPKQGQMNNAWPPSFCCCCHNPPVPILSDDHWPPGWLSVLPKHKTLILRRFDDAEANQTCQGDASPDDVLSDSTSSWTFPGAQVNANGALGKPLAGILKFGFKSGRNPGYAVRIDWRGAPSLIQSFRVQSYEGGPWHDVLKDVTLPQSSSNSSNMIYFGDQLNVHKCELAMTGSQEYSNVGVMRVMLIDNNPNAEFPQDPHDPKLTLPNTYTNGDWRVFKPGTVHVPDTSNPNIFQGRNSAPEQDAAPAAQMTGEKKLVNFPLVIEAPQKS